MITKEDIQRLSNGRGGVKTLGTPFSRKRPPDKSTGTKRSRRKKK